MLALNIELGNVVMKSPTTDLPNIPVFGEGDFDGCAKSETKNNKCMVDDIDQGKAASAIDEVVFLEPSKEASEQSKSSSIKDEVVFLTPTDTVEDEANVVSDKSTIEGADSSQNEEVVFLTPQKESSDDLSDETVNFLLEKKITIKSIDDFKSKLNFNIAITKEVIFDGSEVEIIDTAGLQVLVGVVNKAKAGGKTVCWSGASDELKELSSVLALDSHLGL